MARITMRGRFVFVWLMQIGLTLLLFEETVWNSADNPDISYGYPDSIYITLVRFFCGISMHYLLQEEIEQGLSNMRFALKHM